MERLSSALFVLGCVVLLPTAALAQATVAGVVRDTSGAVLPGVTVEMSSPVLIERVRRSVTDDTGQYRLTELPPGTYDITFTLSGFGTVKREEVEVTGSGVIPIVIEMRVGNVTETVVVTGRTPIVDTQSTRRETVLSNEIINVLPASRGYGPLLTAIPALMTSGTDTIFSAQTTPSMTFFTTHGGRSNEGRMMVDGLTVAASFNGGGVSTYAYDVSNAAEMQVLISGGLGEFENGGPSVNIIPGSGGNTFRGSAFWSGAGNWSRAENIDDYLRSIGITRGPALINSWDVSGTYGGPIKRDRLWFFANARNYGNARAVEGLFGNLNAGDPTKWEYAKNDALESRDSSRQTIYAFRLTAQLTPRNKIAFSNDYQRRCDGSALTVGALADGVCRTREANWVALGSLSVFGNSAPEAQAGYLNPYYHVAQLTWSSPVTNKLLLDAGYSRFHYKPAISGAPPDGILNLIPVTEQSARNGAIANFMYRGISTYADNEAMPNNWRASASYVTGAHSMKVGYQGAYQIADATTVANDTLSSYRFNNGSPNRVTFRIGPWETADRTTTHAIYAQDQGTRGRLTLQGALRYDRASSFSPAEHNGAPLSSRFNAQPIGFPRTIGVSGYNDLTPRMGVAYDLFGNGKTALKGSLGKYLQSATNDENYTVNNPAGLSRFVTNTFRDWTDGNGNRVVDCDLMNPVRQDNSARGGDICAQWNNLNFGNPAPTVTVVNPQILEGWGTRPQDWQFGVSVQQQVAPRVSVDVGYNRRWFGNFIVTDNLTTDPQDYDAWTLRAPLHPLLPGGGGYTATYYNINAAKFGQPARNYVTFETDYAPARTAYWHGVDVTVNARLRNGFVFQGGTSTGRGVRDTCDLTRKLPELLAGFGGSQQQFESCRVTEKWATAFRGLATYTVPKVDVLVSAAVRSTLNNIVSAAASNGTSLAANDNVPNTVVQQTLGRLPSGGLANGNTTVNLLRPGQMYGDDRITLVDMRFAKVLRLGMKRADLGVDLYNLFNSNATTAYLQTFDYATNGATWLQPSTIVQPRFVRLNVTVNF